MDKKEKNLCSSQEDELNSVIPHINIDESLNVKVRKLIGVAKPPFLHDSDKAEVQDYALKQQMKRCTGLFNVGYGQRVYSPEQVLAYGKWMGNLNKGLLLYCNSFQVFNKLADNAIIYEPIRPYLEIAKTREALAQINIIFDKLPKNVAAIPWEFLEFIPSEHISLWGDFNDCLSKFYSISEIPDEISSILLKFKVLIDEIEYSPPYMTLHSKKKKIKYYNQNNKEYYVSKVHKADESHITARNLQKINNLLDDCNNIRFEPIAIQHIWKEFKENISKWRFRIMYGKRSKFQQYYGELYNKIKPYELHNLISSTNNKVLRLIELNCEDPKYDHPLHEDQSKRIFSYPLGEMAIYLNFLFDGIPDLQPAIYSFDSNVQDDLFSKILNRFYDLFARNIDDRRFIKRERHISHNIITAPFQSDDILSFLRKYMTKSKDPAYHQALSDKFNGIGMALLEINK